MEKFQIHSVLECNKVLYKLMENRDKFTISVGFKLYNAMKKFDEVEEYVFELMTLTFGDVCWDSLTEEQIVFYNKLLSEEIELEIEKIPSKIFEECGEFKLSIEEIGKLSIIIS